MKVAVIGGTGVYDLPFIEDREEDKGISPVTLKDKHYTRGTVNGVDVVFIARHRGNTPPHKVDHLATFRVLANEEVDCVIALTACGSLQPELKPGSFAVPDDFIDATGRHVTFIEEVEHPQAVPSIDPDIREILATCFEAHMVGPIVSIPGPRFATRAESMMYKQMNADLINMTTATEASLALEVGLPYAILAIITDFDIGAGVDEPQTTYEQVKERFSEANEHIEAVLPGALGEIADAVARRKDGAE